jgi:hypothetical protein
VIRRFLADPPCRAPDRVHPRLGGAPRSSVRGEDEPDRTRDGGAKVRPRRSSRWTWRRLKLPRRRRQDGVRPQPRRCSPCSRLRSSSVVSLLDNPVRLVPGLVLLSR